MPSHHSIAGFAGVVLTTLLLLPSLAQAQTGCRALAAAAPMLEVAQGQQQETRLPVPITRIAVGDPETADVRLNGNRAFLLTGLKAGATSLMLWTACSAEPQRSLVYVTGNATQALAPSAQPGSVDATLPSQVQTDIRFVDISSSKLKEVNASLFAVSKSNNNLFGGLGTTPGVRVTPGAIAGLKPSIPLVDDAFNIIWGGGSSRALAMVNALEQTGFAYTLAKPSLVALSGQSASFLAGGEFPIPVPSGGSDNFSIEFKEYGVRLTLTPTVIDHQRIHLKVAPEVSELDYTAGIEVSGTRVPALKVRRTDTSISLADGESFIISGLLSSQNTSEVSKFPGLGDIPVLGAFFRANSTLREDRELLMIVTPRLVQPMAAGAPTPELPGEKLRRYDPNFYRMFFLENGRFDSRTGLSD